ncbi:hypothetical protein CYLTODRAFT_169297 [Cylindrobasidium torrendii FP15055 ss-10]|uniref:DUF6534 domain-containing protein n=1 Tax=Cylindrobasidium torrendii FP15055 ss-10 TaxID=1314674 RepID=A0A0D7AXP3_9AGAR|nr:hypothetical protein CYLTODRAFT_169297 [Cylindrobasidium torrendii FP15055 ss-10]
MAVVPSSELDMSLGVLLIAIFFNTYLYGLVTYQFARYVTIKFNDPLWMKGFVLAMFLLDSVHSAAIIYMAYYLCVSTYGQPEALGFALWPYQFTPLSVAIIALMTHLFLTKRIYSLTQSLLLAGGLLFLAFATFGVGIASAALAWTMPTLLEQAALVPHVTAWFAMSFAMDFILAGTLIYTLSRSRTGIARTDTLLFRLIKGAINTGLFAAMFNMGALLSFRFGQTTNFAAFFANPIGRVYSNTLLASLLDRAEMQNLLRGPAGLESNSRSHVSRS